MAGFCSVCQALHGLVADGGLQAKLPELPSLVAQNFRDFDAVRTRDSDVNTIQWWIDLTINEHTDASFKRRHHSHALVCKQDSFISNSLKLKYKCVNQIITKKY